jgi:tetratricopeptide (TPR) repeat protein
VFFIIPLALALVALGGIAVIVWRKMPYLRKLMPESHQVGTTVLHDFAPEAIDWFESIPWRQYVHNALVEFEKFLRRVRLAMSSFDRISDQFIRKVRRVHQETARQHEQIVAEREEEAAAKQEEPDEIDLDDPEQLRQEEQRLIVAIAQDPKDAGLYSRLARVYMRLQNYGDAIEALQQAVKNAPEDEMLAKRLERARRRKEKADQDTAAAVAAGQ